MTIWLVFHDWFPIKLVVTYNISLVWWETPKEDQSSRKEYVMWMCFKFWPIKNIFRKLKPMRVWLWLVYQIYRELFSLATFLRVHSNSKEISYLSWQNTYPKSKTTSHIQLKCFLWTKLLENLLSYLLLRL